MNMVTKIVINQLNHLRVYNSRRVSVRDGEFDYIDNSPRVYVNEIKSRIFTNPKEPVLVLGTGNNVAMAARVLRACLSDKTLYCQGETDGNVPIVINKKNAKTEIELGFYVTINPADGIQTAKPKAKAKRGRPKKEKAIELVTENEEKEALEWLDKQPATQE